MCVLGWRGLWKGDIVSLVDVRRGWERYGWFREEPVQFGVGQVKFCGERTGEIL